VKYNKYLWISTILSNSHSIVSFDLLHIYFQSTPLINMSSAWQIRSSPAKSWRSKEALENLYLNTSVPKPSVIPAGSVLVSHSIFLGGNMGIIWIQVRIRAVAINARDVMVIAHDPVYPVNNIEGLTPCADGAGEIEAVGEGSKSFF